ncbi:MAG: ornithine cyclodeaminase family protein [Burkholderiales bacterium]|nr:ornithine cyclodeaminase family protein [Burkholderiales bacterium]
MLVLGARDVAASLPMAACIDAMRDLFIAMADGAYFNPLRQRARPDGCASWLTMMPARRDAPPALWALKEMAVAPANAAAGLDPIQGAVLLHDGTDGRLLAVVHAGALTAIRTAAVSAVAVGALARAGAREVAILGTGVQGRAHIEAMRLAVPGARIRLWGRDRERAARLAGETGCSAVAALADAVTGADIVCACTAALEPVTRPEWFAPGCHLNAVGSSTPAAREIDAATIARAALFVDRREAALAESGDILGALAAGAITPAHIRAELGEVLAGKAPGRRDPHEFTLYKALGFAALDLAAAELAVREAARAGRGTDVPWQ